MTYAYPLDTAHPGTLADAKALVGGKAANLGRDVARPRAAGAARLRHHDRDLPGVPRGRLARRPRRRAARPDGRRRGGRRPALRRPVGPAARQRPVRGAGLDARDDGHDPRPRARTRRRPPAWPRPPATRPSRGACRERLRVELPIASSASTRSRPIRGSSCARRSRPCSGPGTATARRTYRAKEGIPDDLGTAVTVQAMVFGNRGPTSGTGVLFTRNPATGEAMLYGDVMFDAQGEDVVAGTHATEPITVLDERLPAVAAELRDHAARLERHYADMCDIEFTIEDGTSLDAPDPGRQAQPAGGGPDRRRHGRGRGVPADARRRPSSACGRCSRTPPTVATVAEQPRCCRCSPGCRRRPAWPAAPIALTPEAAQAGADAGRATRSSSGPRPRRTTSTGWRELPAS